MIYLLSVFIMSVAISSLRAGSNGFQTGSIPQPMKPREDSKPQEHVLKSAKQVAGAVERRPRPGNAATATIEDGEFKNIDGVCIFVKEIKEVHASGSVTNGGKRFPKRVCNREKYDIDVFVMEPYRNLMLTYIKEEFKNMREGKNCPNTDLDSFKESIISKLKMNRSSSFTFPFLAYKESDIVHRHHFLPMLDPPGAFYIARKNTISISTLIKNCVQLWPLLVIAMFMSLVSGFVIWILETKYNTEEFPAPFFRGWFEGIWWSFITMTTVGYGDRTPKTIGGRLFSIMWITVGIVIFCILAGELTTVILNAKEGEEHSMINKKIGTLDRLYEKSLVAFYGGYLRPMNRTKNGDEDQQVYTLARKLRQGCLDGVLIDKFTYRYIEGKLGNSTNPDIKYFLHDTVITDIHHKGRKVRYGLLFRGLDLKPSQYGLYLKFKKMFEDKTMMYQMNATRSFQTTLKSVEEDSENHFYKDIVVDKMVVICASVASIFVFGILYEIRRKRGERNHYQ